MQLETLNGTVAQKEKEESLLYCTAENFSVILLSYIVIVSFTHLLVEQNNDTKHNSSYLRTSTNPSTKQLIVDCVADLIVLCQQR